MYKNGFGIYGWYAIKPNQTERNQTNVNIVGWIFG